MGKSNDVYINKMDNGVNYLEDISRFLDRQNLF